jgi:hypothetical protein
MGLLELMLLIHVTISIRDAAARKVVSGMLVLLFSAIVCVSATHSSNRMSRKQTQISYSNLDHASRSRQERYLAASVRIQMIDKM